MLESKVAKISVKFNDMWLFGNSCSKGEKYEDENARELFK